MSQGSRLHMGGCAATWVGWEVTIGFTIHGGMSNLRQKGVGSQNLRHELRARFGTVFCQESINGLELWGTVQFELNRCYKTLGSSHKTMLVHLRFQQWIKAQSVENQAVFEPWSSRMTTYSSNKMVAARRGLGVVEGTSDEATQNPTYIMFPKMLGMHQKSQNHRGCQDRKKISRQ